MGRPGSGDCASSIAIAANNLAWYYAERGGDLGMSLALAQVAAERAPNPADVDHTLGWICYQNGMPSLAIAALRRSVEQDPTKPIYWCHLGLACAGRRLGQREAVTEEGAQARTGL